MPVSGKARFSRPLIIGASGQLGTDLLEAFADLHPVGLAHADIAIEDPASVAAALDRCRPDLVINTAAFHNVQVCEHEPMRALEINGVAVGGLARACAERECAFATFSTDYVFDGQKDGPYVERDKPRPINAYGLSKLAGELLVNAATPRHFLFRTSGLFGRIGSTSKGYTFIDRILQAGAAGERSTVVNDMTFSPSYTRDVAAAVRIVVEHADFGLYHVVNEGSCTWYEFALEALSQAGLHAEVTPISTAQWGADVRRPPNSSLANEGLRRARIPTPPDWRSAVARYVAERASGVSTARP
ncbi:MAG: dTDP-4-dehydrorhamnose reductase [Candidatus Eremiobacteraeota bacterium]|nr:dTDP-4-dehydrorhamnose reductase [Candidatus Eremiobacteraeota bacterium]